jgi:glycosyltransferase involved in cell wall biosynthesis
VLGLGELVVFTSYKAASLKTVSSHIVKVASRHGVRAVIDYKLTPSAILRAQGRSALIVMPVDPLYATPWMLLARDCRKGWVPALYYGPVEGRLNTRYVYPWMREVQFVAPSGYVREKLVEAGLNVTAVVHHGVDMDEVREAKRNRRHARKAMAARAGFKEDDIIVLTVSSSLPRKGLAWYARVTKLMAGRDPNVKFYVLTDENALKLDWARENTFIDTNMGRYSRVDVMSMVAAADILAHPAMAEGFGLPVLEAHAVGTPVVHVDIPPLREFSVGWRVPYQGVSLLDTTPAGPSGIIFENYWWEPGDFVGELAYVIDLIRSRSSELEEYRAKAWEVAAEHDIMRLYPRLLDMLTGGLAYG